MDDLEKELLNYDDMGTTIEKIKKPNINLNKFNINNFVKELENNLDNFDNTNEYTETPAFNQDFKQNVKERFTEDIVNFEEEDDNNEESEKELENCQNWNNIVLTFLLNIKEPIIIILVFILLNNNDLILLINKLFLINNIKNEYISLIIRGIVLAIITYYLKNL
jgi:hypothetical protein